VLTLPIVILLAVALTVPTLVSAFVPVLPTVADEPCVPEPVDVRVAGPVLVSLAAPSVEPASGALSPHAARTSETHAPTRRVATEQRGIAMQGFHLSISNPRALAASGRGAGTRRPSSARS
jgi:hypothetical protein